MELTKCVPEPPFAFDTPGTPPQKLFFSDCQKKNVYEYLCASLASNLLMIIVCISFEQLLKLLLLVHNSANALASNNTWSKTGDTQNVAYECRCSLDNQFSTCMDQHLYIEPKLWCLPKGQERHRRFPTAGSRTCTCTRYSTRWSSRGSASPRWWALEYLPRCNL